MKLVEHGTLPGWTWLEGTDAPPRRAQWPDTALALTQLGLLLAAAILAAYSLGLAVVGWLGPLGTGVAVTVRLGVVVGLLMPFLYLMAFRPLRQVLGRWRAAEVAFREVEERYRNLLRHTPEVIFVLSPDGKFTCLNPAFEVITGWTCEAWLGRHFTELVHPEDLPQARLFFQRLVDAARPVRVTLRVQKRDGGYLMAELTVAPRFEQGKLREFLGVGRDVTERQRTELRLRETERRYRDIIESSTNLFYAHGPDHILTYVSPQCTALLDCDPEEALVDWRGWVTDHPDNAAGLAAAQRALDTGQVQPPYELELRTPAGRLVRVEVREAPVVLEGRPVAVVGSFTDITERWRAEAQLREQARLLDLAHDAIVAQDFQGRVRVWNHGAERLFGWTRAEACAEPVNPLGYDDPRQVETALDSVRRVGDWNGELVLIRKDRRRIVVESRWTLVCDRQGRPESILAISLDITERKKLEAQLFRAQRLESIGVLAGGIAHDLNNVLAPIVMAADFLRVRCAEGPERIILHNLEKSAIRGAEIVRQVLTFARGNDGQRVDLQLRHLLREIVTMVRETFPKEIHVELVMPEDLWTVQGDSTQLYQVLMNLCVNARDAMPRGGDLRIAAENVVLNAMQVPLQGDAEPGPYVLLQVIDTGTGIKPEIFAKIFDPFFSTKPPEQGTGLGLSTSLAIAKAHGGFIHFASEVGRGSRFRVYLPSATAAHSARTPVKERVEPPAGQGELVLMIDDEVSFRETVRLILEAHGYRVLLAANGAEAAGLCAQHDGAIRAAFVDLMMPFMDGCATIRVLQKLSPSLKFVVVSGMVDPARVDDVNALGARAFLQKPFPAEQMLLTLHDVLHASTSHPG